MRRVDTTYTRRNRCRTLPTSIWPAYVLYSAGRLMLLKLREDLQAREGSAFSLKSFHDRLLGQGSLPFWLHRTLLLGDTGDALLD